jgi:eukaryotic-like serine/threonine-protein kinase
MNLVVTCPDRTVLQRLLLGQLPFSDSQRLAEHLHACLSCTAVVRTFTAVDTLVEAARARTLTVDAPDREAVRHLVEWLRRLEPIGDDNPTLARDETPSNVSVPVVLANPEGGYRVTARKQADGYDFLEAAREPGELGWLGSYRILKLLGSGGMGLVFAAEDVHRKRPVALKVMKPEMAGKPVARERFMREARVKALLDHENIVPILEVGEEHGVPFITMPLLKGVSLEDWLQRNLTLSVAQVLRLGVQIARGLVAAHAAGLVHRDIKPANLWLEPEQGGRIKILDFGVARAVTDDSKLTHRGGLVGTPAFLAPEQAAGAKVDHRSDLFSLGVVLYRLATGHLPFRGDSTMTVLFALANQQPKPVRELNPNMPEALAELIAQLLAKDPGARPASAGEVVERLEALERQPGEKAESRKPKAENRGSFFGFRILGFGIFLLLLGVLGFLFGGTVFRLATNQGQGVIEELAEAGPERIAAPGPDEEPIPAIQPAVPEEAERGTARWVLQMGGSLTIRVGDREQVVGTVGDLSEVFQVVAVTIPERTTLSDAALADLGKLPNLERLLLMHVRISDAGLVHLAQLSKLKVLRLDGTKVSDAGLAHLKNLVSLETLWLIHCGVSDDGLVHLTTLPALRDLLLGDTRVTDAGLAFLLPQCSLRILDLGKTRVTDAGLAHVKSQRDLERLMLQNTQVTDAGLEHLTTLSKLKHLHLNETRVSDAGRKYLVQLPGLTVLGLRGARVSAQGIASLRAAFPMTAIEWSEPNRTAAETVLALGGTVTIRVEGEAEDQRVKTAAELPDAYYRLTRANLAGITRPLVELCSKLGALTDPDFDRLQALDFSCTTFADNHIHRLHSLPALAELSLAQTAISDGGVKRLKDLKGLRRLILDGTSIRGPGLADLKALPDLTELSLARTQVNDAGLEHLKGLKKLRRLVLDGLSLRGAGLAHLKELTGLRELRLGCPTLADLFLMHLGEMKQLQRLVLAGSGVADEGLEQLHGLTGLQEMDLRGAKVTKAGIAKLQKALPKCRIMSGPLPE